MFRKIKEVMEFIKEKKIEIIVLSWFILMGLVSFLLA
jgi:2-hydroxy-3-keto-5-methylthiopentenyl-1-phosphate phosphatase